MTAEKIAEKATPSLEADRLMKEIENIRSNLADMVRQLREKLKNPADIGALVSRYRIAFIIIGGLFLLSCMRGKREKVRIQYRMVPMDAIRCCRCGKIVKEKNGKIE